MQLTEPEEQQLRRDLHKLEPQEEEWIMRIMTSYERKGWIEGEKAGEVKGKIEGIIEMLCKYVAACFPESAAELQGQLQQIKEAALLERLSETIFHVKRPEQLRELLAAALDDCEHTQSEL